MNANETIILSRREVAQLLGVDECIDAMERVFRLYGLGKAQKPGVLGIHVPAGVFHFKAGVLKANRYYFVAKTNANFPDNPTLHGLPTIQGVISVFDADNGKLLALLDTIEISILRTGAATAVAAKYLAREDSKRMTISGTGNQGRVSIRSLTKLFSFEKVFVHDMDESKARNFAIEMSGELNLDVEYTPDLSKATRQSDICITCTPSRQAYLFQKDIRPGTFIAAVGSDNENKQELDTGLVASAKLITDITEQCASMGELHHAIRNGSIRKEDVFAELGEVVAGKKPGREKREEVIIFDSTGMALQDVAAAAIVYEKTFQKEIGLRVNLNN